MKKETRRVYHDTCLAIEAYYFLGIVQKFPYHFHEEYVIGYIESGERYAYCKGQKYRIRPGDLLVFNPHDTHACEQVGDFPLDWRCIFIKPESMRKIAQEITGTAALPYFSQPVLYQSELVAPLHELHESIVSKNPGFRKEEVYFLLIQQLIEEYGTPGALSATEAGRPEIEAVCRYLATHYAQPVTLDELCSISALSKSQLLRSFTKQKGISPYRYLETVRIDRAKKLLEQGVKPIDAAAATGFSDQSHFSNFFKSLIGLTPGQYLAIFQEGTRRKGVGYDEAC